MTKQYISINYKNLTTSVFLKDREVSICFKNHIFTTDNEELQNAIENDSAYNIEFSVIKVKDKLPLLLKIENDKTDLEDVLTVSNKQQAIEFLSSIGIKLSNNTSVKTIKESAVTKGYNFVNLK